MQQHDSAKLLQVVQLDTAMCASTVVAGPAANQIGPGKHVSLYFSLSLTTGEVVDSCFNKAPARFSIGDGSMLPGFEQALFGLEPGAELRILLSPEQAFGQPSAGNIQRFPRYRFPADLPLSRGLMIDFADNNGAMQPGVVLANDSNWVQIDFNHPLAGRSILFHARVIGVEEGGLGHG